MYLWVLGGVLNPVLVVLELTSQVIINHVHADFLGALLGILPFITKIVHQEGYIVPDFFVVSLEIFRVVVLDGAPKVFVFKERFQHLFFQVVNIAFMQRIIYIRFSNRFSFNQNLLGQRPGGIFLVDAPSKQIAIVII